MVILNNSLYFPVADECFSVSHDKALFGHNTKSVPGVSVDECKTLCLEETTFSCLSFDYIPRDSGCFLSEESSQTDPAMFGNHHDSEYYEKTEYCLTEYNLTDEQNGE